MSNEETLDYYQILGLAPNASQSEIRKSFKALAQKYHPDRVDGSEESFRRIKRAYDTLKNPQKRAIYDQGIQQGFSHEEFKMHLEGVVEQIINGTMEQLLVPVQSFATKNVKQAMEVTFRKSKAEAQAQEKNLEGMVCKLNKKLDKIKHGQKTMLIQALEQKRVRFKNQLQSAKIIVAVFEYLENDLDQIEMKPEQEEQQVRLQSPFTSTRNDPFFQWNPKA